MVNLGLELAKEGAATFFVKDHVVRSRPVVLTRGMAVQANTAKLHERFQADEFVEKYRDVLLTTSRERYVRVADYHAALEDAFQAGQPPPGGGASGERIDHAVAGWELYAGAKRTGMTRQDYMLQKSDLAPAPRFEDGAAVKGFHRLGRGDPARMLQDWVRPMMVRDRQFDTAGVRLLLGPAGAREPLTASGHRWEWLLHGRKRVHLLPPSRAAHALEREGEGEGDGEEEEGEEAGMPPGAIACTLEPGEVLYVPFGWSLATEYLEPSIAWSTEFHHDRQFVV